MRDCVGALLASIGPTDTEVLRRRRFGIGGGAPETCEMIARSAGASHIRSMERRALEALRAHAQANGAHVFLESGV